MSEQELAWVRSQVEKFNELMDDHEALENLVRQIRDTGRREILESEAVMHMVDSIRLLLKSECAENVHAVRLIHFENALAAFDKLRNEGTEQSGELREASR